MTQQNADDVVDNYLSVDAISPDQPLNDWMDAVVETTIRTGFKDVAKARRETFAALCDEGKLSRRKSKHLVLKFYPEPAFTPAILRDEIERIFVANGTEAHKEWRGADASQKRKLVYLTIYRLQNAEKIKYRKGEHPTRAGESKLYEPADESLLARLVAQLEKRD